MASSPVMSMLQVHWPSGHCTTQPGAWFPEPPAFLRPPQLSHFPLLWAGGSWGSASQAGVGWVAVDAVASAVQCRILTDLCPDTPLWGNITPEAWEDGPGAWVLLSSCSSFSAPSVLHGPPDMRRLFLITGLVAMLLQEASMAPAPQVPVKFQVRLRAHEQDTEKAWGARVLASLEKGLLPILKLRVLAVNEELPGTKAWVEPEDILGRVWSPLQDPEPDHDSLYHPLTEDQGGARPWPRALPSRQVLPGPEEDRDHIYHPAEGPGGP
ncbi:proline-rich acidic protein 1 [Nycticebus coucang]|uniref:proline-rich acidic protein 1 n=1 Tax=Nycticebus coucang TaxID=9470 RepID=UPI00234D5A51|nr:proline-rich acidic protein 1 [Nycticebus coucang]